VHGECINEVLLCTNPPCGGVFTEVLPERRLMALQHLSNIAAHHGARW
jgi:hypothetical protein